MRYTLTILAAFCAMALLFMALSKGNPVAAQTTDIPTPIPTAEHPGDFGDQSLPPIEGKLNPPQHPNMDSNLNRIVERFQAGRFTARAVAENAPIHDSQSVAVTLYITEGFADTIAAYLESNGGAPRNIGVDYIEAYVPVSLLAQASQQEGVISIRTIIPPRPAQGAVVSDGAALHGAPAWHAAGIKGRGVKIGIIDLGFEGFQSLMGAELPSSAQARCYTDVGVFTSNISDCTNSEDSERRRLHGTAVTEAIFDIAPEATYYIANPYSQGDLQATVNWMVEQDVDVINHSVVWIWEGPGDGTSPFGWSTLRSVDAAVANGIVWINAAGNSAQDTWYGRFADFNGDGWHEFSGTDNCNNYAIYDDAGQIHLARYTEEVQLLIDLRWDDRWGGANTDLDLFLARWNETTRRYERYASSTSEQSGGAAHIPMEIIAETVPAGWYCIAVAQYSGATPSWLQLRARKAPILEHHTLHHSIGSPAESANPGLLAVGAAPASDTNTIEPYSSQGPTPDGRIKPDIVGVARAQSVSYRSAERPDGRWIGTSQSSPHVAGLAALVKQRFPQYSPQQVAGYLKSHATERGEAGPDNVWGHGFARLLASEASPSSDATLRTLSLSGLTLVPGFDPATTAYTAEVDTLETTTVEAMATHSGAMVSGTGDVSLDVGENTITVMVTAEDGTAMMTYTVMVTVVEPLTDEARLLAEYDANGDGSIDGTELNNAIDKYLAEELSSSDMNIIIDLYLQG